MTALTKTDWQRAIDVQDACNLSGVVHSLAEVLPRIREDNPGTAHVNRHPIVVLYVSKLSSLSGAQFNEMEAFSQAYQAAQTAIDNEVTE